MNQEIQARDGKTNVATSKSNTHHSAHLAVFMFLALAADMALAQGGNPVQSMLDGVIGFLNSGVMRSVAILAVIGMGVAAYLGKISWEMAMRAGAGIILTFGAAALVDQFSAYVG